MHEFIPYGKISKQRKLNEQDLETFVERLNGETLKPNEWYDPVKVPGNENIPNTIPFYIDKIETVIGTNQ